MIGPPTAAWIAAGVGVAWFVTLVIVPMRLAARTGDLGVRMPSGSRRWAGIASATLSWMGLASLVSAIVLQARGSIEPWFVSPLSVAAGVALVAAGAVVSVVGQAQMGASWRSGVDEAEDTELVTTGLFSMSRNPTYVGVQLSFAGLALLVAGWLSLTGVALAAIALQVQVRWAEEPYLLCAHGDVYREYMRRVGRFVPRPARGGSR